MNHRDDATIPADSDPLPAAPPAAAQALGRLAADLAQQPVPPLSARARQALRPARGRPAPMRPWWRSATAWGLSGAALCGVGLIGSVLLLVLTPTERSPVTARAGWPGAGFVTVASAERWQQLLGDDVSAAWVVPAEIPNERLAVLGLPFDPARAGDRISAELLMHPSGEVLAVRVLGP